MTLSPREIVQNDLAGIYLGNLGTVDADLALPRKGELGSTFVWGSRQSLFIDHQGKVTRPSFGIGNRTVELVVTASFKDYTEDKVFTANVLEEEYLANTVQTFPVHITVAPGQLPELPTVVVVLNDHDQYTVAPVAWDQLRTDSFNASGVVEVMGKVEGTDLPAMAMVQITELLDKQHAHCKPRKRVAFFPDNRVSLENDSVFANARDRMIEFLLKVDDDQMLYSFRVAAGLDTKGAPPMTGWDNPEGKLRGHTTGHYLSALALAYAGTGATQLKTKLDYMVEQLKLCQDAMSIASTPGFLSAYSEEQFDLLEQYTRYPAIWAPYYTLHKILAGLRDCYSLAGSELALEVYTRLGDWVHRRLTRLPRQQLDKMWSMYIAGEFGGMNEVMADLYMLTGEERHLQTARLFDNVKLFLPMEQNHDSLGTLHANQHIPQIIGALKLFQATGEERYRIIASNFWDMVARHHTYSIGGTGETEMFRQPDVIGRLLTAKTAESCASYNMMKLSKELFEYHPEAKYMDYYARAMFNHILASADNSSSSAGTTYFMPLAPASRKSFDTAENTCCHGTGLETQLKYHECIYAYDDDSLYVNLYIPSQVTWQDKGVEIVIPAPNGEGQGRYEILIKGSASFALKLRRPYWAERFTIWLNNTKVAAELTGGYYTLLQAWNHDIVTVEAPFTVWTEESPDVPGLCSVFYGPHVLAALSGQADHLTVRLEDFEQTGPLEFLYQGIRFVPLSRVNRETYHVYFRR
jgi:uncharacterized protein